jgi:hypothetical protein
VPQLVDELRQDRRQFLSVFLGEFYRIAVRVICFDVI